MRYGIMGWAWVMCGVWGVQAQVEAVWLTHRSATPEKTVINWKSVTPGASCVRYGEDQTCSTTLRVAGERTLHHVEIPTPQLGLPLFYCVESGPQRSGPHRIVPCPEDQVRVAILADLGYAGRPDLSALKADNPHFLMTAGDQVPHIINPNQAGDVTYIQPYIDLFKAESNLFTTTRLMPILGNHDKQVGPRDNKRPGQSRETYDIAATAYLSIFSLPEPGWRWAFTIPQADVTFLALDMHHLSDFGTTFQTSHDHHPGSEQFAWYDEQSRNAKTGFVVTLFNASSRARNEAKGAWHEMFSRGTLCITGYGYYAERAVEKNGLPYYNTCVAKAGDVYRDPKAVVCEPLSNYMLLTFNRAKGELQVALKQLDGRVIDSQVYHARHATPVSK